MTYLESFQAHNCKENALISVFLQTKILLQESFKYKGVFIAINWLRDQS